MTASTPRRLTPSTKSHSSSSVLTKKANRSVPALLTSTSISPSAAIGGGDRGAHRAGVGHVERAREPVELAGDLTGALLVDVADRHARALGRQPPRGGRADPRGAAGDERGLAL